MLLISAHRSPPFSKGEPESDLVEKTVKFIPFNADLRTFFLSSILS